jgi:hypothetical protein
MIVDQRARLLFAGSCCTSSRCIGKGIYCTAPICVSVRSTQMFDLIMLAIGLGFFALSIGYAYACDQL